MIAVADAYAECSRITASQAKNFAYGIKLLDRPRRDAMSAIYALARRIDDIGDGDLPVDRKREALDLVRKQLGDLGGAEDDAVLVALADTHARYRLPLDEFELLVEGCELDVDGVGCASFADLAAYCRRVAGSIGRLSLAVFGTDYPESAEPRAEALGVALQVTNILRDVVEDRTMGRAYLPRDEAEALGCAPDLSGPTEALTALVAAQVPRAKEHFTYGLQLLPLLDRRSRACVAAMAGIYRQLLVRIEADPGRVLRERVSLSAPEKVWIATRSLAVGRA